MITAAAVIAVLIAALGFAVARVNQLALTAALDKVTDLTKERDYWRGRAEKLIDAGLVRTGAIHEPTMVERKPPPARDMASLITSALSTTEIDSSKKKGAA